MNKRDFIKELEKRLAILDEKEIKDIVNEYKDIIEEKVKNGKTEEEAVSEFGSIDELTSEILKAYKINPKYSNDNKDSFKEVKDNYEGWIKDTAKNLSQTTKGIYDSLKKSNNDISIELVFELIIKFIIMLIILAILRLPFAIINGLGESIFDMAFFPADTVFSMIWRLFTSVLYFGVCILVFIAMFKNYVNYNQSEYDVKEKKSVKPQKKEASNNKNEFVRENAEVRSVKTNNTNNSINSVLTIIYRVFMVIIFLIPLWFIQLGLVIGLGVTIYYTCLGINIWGLIIVLAGLTIGAGWAINIFTQLTFKIEKVHFYPAFISILVICIGSLVFVGNILSFDYIDKAPETSKFKLQTKEKEFTLSTLAPIISERYDTSYEVDSDLNDNIIRVEFTYCQSLRSVNGVLLNYDALQNVYKLDYFEYSTTNFNDFNDFKDSYNLFIDNLKDGKIYNYEKLGDISIKIFASEQTINQIKQ